MELLHIGPITIYSYGLMMALGMIAAVWLGMRRCTPRGLDKDEIFNMGFMGIVAGVIGAKLTYYIVELPAIIVDPSMLLDLTSGFVVYGGIIAGVLIPVIYAKAKNLPIMKYLDVAAPCIPLAQGFGRIGCYLAGCCYGCATDSWIGVVFPEGSLAPAGVSLIPTQLISAIGDFAIAGILLLYTRKDKEHPDGTGMAWYMVLYAIGRFVIEIFRNDPRGNVWFLSTSQFISIFIFVAGVIWLVEAISKHKADAQAALEAKVEAELAAEEEARKEKANELKKVGVAFEIHESPAIVEEGTEESAEEDARE